MQLSYIIRKSRLAKYPQLKISSKGIEVVLPLDYPLSATNELLHTKRDWIKKQLVKFPPLVSIYPPQEMCFPAISQHWQIKYQTGPDKACLQEHVNHLLISGQYHAQNKWQLLLRIWLKKQAKIVLPNWLNELSKKNNLPFNSVYIRAQKTRWGSCSARKNINLNYQLLFLPTDLVQHILLHELCHTVHLNHSKAFWQLLTRLDPNTLHLKHQTRHPYLFVPQWI